MKLLPVGTYVLVKQPEFTGTDGRVICAAREYYAVVVGYDMWRSKYEVGSRYAGWGRWLFSDGGSWPFPGWVTEVTEEEARRIK